MPRLQLGHALAAKLRFTTGNLYTARCTHPVHDIVLTPHLLSQSVYSPALLPPLPETFAMLRQTAMCGLLGLTLACLGPAAAPAQTPTGDQLPDTQPLTLTEPMDVAMVRGISRFAERELAASRERRAAKWNRETSSRDAYVQSVEPQRQRFRELIGAIDARSSTITLWRDASQADALPGMPVQEVQWDVLEGVSAEGVGLNLDRLQSGHESTPAALVVLLPDAGQLPEDQAGLNDALPRHEQLALRLAQHGCVVLAPTLIDRECTWSGHADIRWTNVTHRELVYRCGFELGRHVIGYEVQKVQAAIDYFESVRLRFPDARIPIAVVGAGEGGLLAFYAAAIDPRIDVCCVRGYFGPRESVWQEPIYRNVWGLLAEFGDAEIASLVAPRALIVDAAPSIDVPLASPQDGRLSYAAPGVIRSAPFQQVEAEYLRAMPHYEVLRAGGHLVNCLPENQAQPPENWLHAVLSECQIRGFVPATVSQQVPGMLDAAKLSERQYRQVDELVRHTQTILHRSDKVREKFWKEADRSSPEKWAETSQRYRDHVHDHMIGRLPLPTAPLNPRTRKVIDEPTHTGWEVVLDVYGPSPLSSDESPEQSPTQAALDTGLSTLDSTVIAGGILLLPKDLQPGEQRPVVVCQHGLEGVPMDTITMDQSAPAWAPYKGFSTQLVKRGFIVYAPQNPYRGEDEFRVIQRKSNPLGRSLFSYIIEQHRQTLTWLATLPYVDPNRIAFYGLSYGGKTAVRVPPLLKRPVSSVQSPETAADENTLNSQPSTLNHPEYCLSICSADFNEWIRKNCSAEDRYSYVYTKEYEMFEWNMGHVAGYAELSSLMAPRPFMVERGHDDGVAPDEWVGWEYAKVRRHYDKLGLGDKTEIEWFNGPHTINGLGTFAFLYKHLDWPGPRP